MVAHIWKMVGYVSHTATNRGIQELSADDVGTVSVKAGDTLGIHYPHKNPIPYSTQYKFQKPCTKYNEWWGIKGDDPLVFNHSAIRLTYDVGHACRDYSFQVDVQPGKNDMTLG